MPKYKIKFKKDGKSYIATVKAPNQEAARQAVLKKEGGAYVNE